MFSVKRLFRARSERFYVLFAQVATNISEMEQVFHQSIYENNLAINKAQLKRAEELEHANDMSTHRLIIELGRNFITPFDREDIHTLATSLDDIVDYMYAIIKQRINYGLQKCPRETQLVAEKLKSVIKLLAEILRGLNERNLLKLVVLGKEIKVQLSACDAIIDTGMAGLFSQKADIIDTIKLTDHFNFVQTLLDKCGDAVNVIDSIVIKYS